MGKTKTLHLNYPFFLQGKERKVIVLNCNKEKISFSTEETTWFWMSNLRNLIFQDA